MADDGRNTDQAGGAATSTASRPGLLRSIAHRLSGESPVLPVEGHLPGFDGATGWLNSEPLTPAGLRGRVVLVDFWTYTCINWLRTLPYRRAWHEKYRDLGVTLIGAHTPEFGFERNVDNIIPRAREFGVEYPIAIDSDYGVWQAFANHYWPALYVADAEGRIRYHHFGEGEYAMSEMVVQQLLLEAGIDGFDPELVTVDPKGFEVPADWSTLGSPETYLAYGRSSGFASPDHEQFNEPHRYPETSRLDLNEWAPIGDVDARAARCRAQRARWTGRLPLPGARRQPRDGPRDARSIDPIPRHARWDGTRRRPRRRCRRGGQRHPGRPAPASAHPARRRERRSHLRDRVPRRGCRGVLLHVRLKSPGDQAGRLNQNVVRPSRDSAPTLPPAASTS